MMPTRYGIGDEPFRGPNPPYGALITFHLKEAAQEDAAPKMEILDGSGAVLRALEGRSEEAGMHRVVWDLAGEEPRPRSDEPGPQAFFAFGPLGPQVPPGNYRARLTVGSTVLEKPVVVKLDPTDGFGPGLARDAIPAHDPASRPALFGERRSPRARQPESPRSKSGRRRSRPRRKKCPTP